VTKEVVAFYIGRRGLGSPKMGYRPKTRAGVRTYGTYNVGYQDYLVLGSRIVSASGLPCSVEAKTVDEELVRRTCYELASEPLLLVSETRPKKIQDEYEQVAKLRAQNVALRSAVEKHLPHRQFLRIGALFLLFFSAVLAVQLLAGIWLISTALALTGMATSFSIVILSHLAKLDLRDWKASTRRR
jgi:hypothetical protein